MVSDFVEKKTIKLTENFESPVQDADEGGHPRHERTYIAEILWPGA